MLKTVSLIISQYFLLLIEEVVVTVLLKNFRYVFFFFSGFVCRRKRQNISKGDKRSPSSHGLQQL